MSGNFVFMKNHLVPVKSWKPVFKRRNSATLKKGHSIQVNINPTLQKCEHSPVVVKKTQIVFAPAPSRQTQSAAWTSTVAIIPTQYHEPPPNTRPQYACGRPLSHEQCKEGKTQQNSETRVFLRVHPFLSMDEQCPLCNQQRERVTVTLFKFSRNAPTSRHWLCLCHMSSARSTSDGRGRGPVTPK